LAKTAGLNTPSSLNASMNALNNSAKANANNAGNNSAKANANNAKNANKNNKQNNQLLSNLEFKTITVPYTDYSDEDEKIKTKELLILSSKIVSYKDKKEEINPMQGMM